jgi:hypothetical protein
VIATVPESARPSDTAGIDESFLAVAAMTDDDQRSLFYQGLLKQCLEIDPTMAAERALAMSDEKLRNLGVAFVLLHWAQSDPRAALQWAFDHPREPHDDSRVFAAYEGLAERDPLAAMHWLQQPELAPNLDEFSRILIHHYESQGRLADARREIEQLPPGELRDWLVLQATRAWAAQSPVEAGRWLAAVASDQGFSTAMNTLTLSLVERNPTLAADLTQQFAGDPQVNEALLADVIYVWARRDLGAAAAWLRQQPPAPSLDAARVRMVETTAPYDPVEAAAWANTIMDSQKRAAAMRQFRPGG